MKEQVKLIYHLRFALSIFIASFCSYKTPVAFKNRFTPKTKEFITVLKRRQTICLHLLDLVYFRLSQPLALPLSNQFLMEEEFGIQLSAKETLLIIVVIPEVVKMLTPPYMPWHSTSSTLLVCECLSICFSPSIAMSFFSATSYNMILIGTILQGIAMGGGSVAWQLWVTS